MKRSCGVTKIGFAAFWIVASILFLYRICFDVDTYFNGSTITYRNSATYDYLFHFPKGYHDFGGRRPLIIFLHGAGETGKDVNVLRKLDIYHYANGEIDPKDFPFLVVSPMTPKHGWEPRRIVRLLDELLADERFRYRIDPNRVYLTGFSMGGFGTFRTACEYPERFAAIVPLAGGGEPELAEKLKNVPTWAFHGNADKVVDYECSQKMIEAMQELNHDNVRLTTLEGAGHGIPELVYNRTELYRWLLEQKLTHE